MIPLQRRTRLSPKPRSKGARGELAVIKMLRAHGWTTARRNWMSGGAGGSDLVEAIPGVAIEIKNCQTCSIWSWIAQCELAARPTEIPVVAFTRNHSPWYGCLPTDELNALVTFSGRHLATVIRKQERAQIWKWIGEAQKVAVLSPGPVGRIPAVDFRRASSGWYSVVPLDDLLEMLRLRETT